MAVDVGGKEGLPDAERRVCLQANPSYVGSGLADTSGNRHLRSHHLRCDIAVLRQRSLSPRRLPF
jgi:hypothetical protein